MTAKEPTLAKKMKDLALELDALRIHMVIAHKYKPNSDCHEKDALHWNGELVRLQRVFEELAESQDVNRCRNCDHTEDDHDPDNGYCMKETYLEWEGGHANPNTCGCRKFEPNTKV